MSRATILYELFNLSISGGTGIATYARNLCSNARELGYDTDGLLHSYRAIDKRDPILAEVSFFDARNREISPFDRFATLRLRNAQHLVSSAEGVSNHAASHEPMTACNQHFHIRLTSCEKHVLYRKTANSEPDYWPII